MKNIIILILLGIVAYLLYTSGIFNRAVQSVPQLLASTPNPNETPQISVTVYSPYGTGNKTPAPNAATALPLITTVPQPTAIPDVPIFVPPTPVVIVPEVPPTLALPNTPTPAATFPMTLTTPRDGETTNTSPLLVSGVTAPGAIVSVNDVVGVANVEGRFDLMVALQAGPNVLEVIASQANGQQAFMIVTAMYQP
jgi:Glucodextranase, domain B